LILGWRQIGHAFKPDSSLLLSVSKKIARRVKLAEYYVLRTASSKYRA
jgi:hypothetical protein